MWHCGLPAGEVEALLSESEALVYGFRARAELGSRAHCNARRVAAHAATGGEVLWLHDDCGDVSLADGSVCAALSAVPGFGADGMQIFGWEDNERPKDVGAHAEAVSVRKSARSAQKKLESWVLLFACKPWAPPSAAARRSRLHQTKPIMSTACASMLN